MVKVNDKIKQLKREMQINYFSALKYSNLDCVSNLIDSIVHLKEKSKYVYLDRGQGGVYLINEDMKVYNIKGYGKKGYLVGHIDDVIKSFKEENKNIEKHNIAKAYEEMEDTVMDAMIGDDNK